MRAHGSSSDQAARAIRRVMYEVRRQDSSLDPAALLEVLRPFLDQIDAAEAARLRPALTPWKVSAAVAVSPYPYIHPEMTQTDLDRPVRGEVSWALGADTAFALRVTGYLKREGIETIGTLIRWSGAELQDLIRGFGSDSVDEVNRLLGLHGLGLSPHTFEWQPPAPRGDRWVAIRNTNGVVQRWVLVMGTLLDMPLRHFRLPIGLAMQHEPDGFPQTVGDLRALTRHQAQGFFPRSVPQAAAFLEDFGLRFSDD